MTARAIGALKLASPRKQARRLALTVLDLLAVARRLLQRLDDQRGSGRHDLDLGLAVLHEEFGRDAEALPVQGGLRNIIANLLWREAQRANLRRQRRHSTDLPACHAHVDDLDLVRIKLGRHGGLKPQGQSM